MTQLVKFKNYRSTPDDKYVWFLFLLWPFYALIFAIKNYKHTFAKNLLWLFVIFYGYTMVINGSAEEGADATRYRDSFIEVSNRTFASIDFKKLFFNEEEDGALDILQPVIVILVSRLTNNYHFLFAVFGLVFGFFYSRNIWFLIDSAGHKIRPISLSILITFALIVGFWNINGFRYYTATHIFLYGALLYLVKGEKKGLVILLVSPLMHFSFLFPIVILLAYIYIGNRSMIYFYFFLGSLFLTELNLSFVKDLITNITPEMFHKKVTGYVNQEYAEGQIESVKQLNWYVQFYERVLEYAILIPIIAIYYNGKTFISRHRNFDNLFSFALFFSGMANLACMIPTGGRFMSLSSLLLAPLIFWYLQYVPREQLVKKLVLIAIPALSFFCIVAIRISFDTIGLLTVFGNPILAPFMGGDVPLIDLVKKYL